jgi:hypothetical protein
VRTGQRTERPALANPNRQVTLSGTYGGIQLAAAMVAERIAAARPAARLSSDGGGLRGAGRLGSFEEEDVGAYDD